MDQSTPTSLGNNILLPPTEKNSRDAKNTSEQKRNEPRFNGNFLKKSKSGALIATVLGIGVLVLSIGAGVIALQRQQAFLSKAWSCSTYTFLVSQNGVVTLTNGSVREEPPQSVKVLINGQQVATLQAPRIEINKTVTLGTVTVPTNGFAWSVIGLSDCSNSGSYPSSTASPGPSSTPVDVSCSAVKAYSYPDWNALSANDLKSLKAGDSVYFTVVGSSTNPSLTFDKARFKITVNGIVGDWIESSSVKPGSNEFYYKYTIVPNASSFNVNAQIHVTNGNWY